MQSSSLGQNPQSHQPPLGFSPSWFLSPKYAVFVQLPSFKGNVYASITAPMGLCHIYLLTGPLCLSELQNPLWQGLYVPVSPGPRHQIQNRTQHASAMTSTEDRVWPSFFQRRSSPVSGVHNHISFGDAQILLLIQSEHTICPSQFCFLTFFLPKTN